MFAFRTTLIAAITACVYMTAVNGACDRSYTVQPGDVCDAISAAQNASTYQLASANPTINAGCTNLFVGEVLCLGLAGEDCDVVHVVASGDTCFDIAQAAGTGLDTLLANNPNVGQDCTIYPGEVLCTATTVIAA